jgi:1-acyl-sn-glycerol-3-phosphate acyltransferase
VLTKLGLYKLLGENPERTWPFARAAVKPITRVLCPSYGYGHELMPAHGALVIAANHFSEIDPAIVGLHSRRTLYYMAKIELLSFPIFGELLRWTGAFAVRRGEGDRDSVRVAQWALRNGHAVGVFTEGTRQKTGHPGPMHAGAAMLAIQEGVPVVPCGVDTFGWSVKNRRTSCVVWGEPMELDVPRNGKGDKEATLVVQERITALWRIAAQAAADGFPETLANGLRRSGPLKVRNTIVEPDLPNWPSEEWAEEPLGPVYRRRRDYTDVTKA